MDDFIIDKDTKIYNIKVINCVVNIPKYIHHHLYTYILIIVNNIIEVCLPIPNLEKEYIKELILFPANKYPKRNIEKQGQITLIVDWNINDKEDLELNYNVKLLEKILKIEDCKFNHSQLLDFLQKEQYIDINRRVYRNMINHSLIEKIINFYNNGKMHVNILERNEIIYRNTSYQNTYDREISIFNIKLFTKLQMKKNNYKIFTNTDELMMDLTEIEKIKKYKVLKFGYKLTPDINEFSILEEIDDDIEKFINSSLIDLDEKKDSNLINLDEIEAINLDEKL
jgi:hypothetical protein